VEFENIYIHKDKLTKDRIDERVGTVNFEVVFKGAIKLNNICMVKKDAPEPLCRKTFPVWFDLHEMESCGDFAYEIICNDTKWLIIIALLEALKKLNLYPWGDVDKAIKITKRAFLDYVQKEDA